MTHQKRCLGEGSADCRDTDEARADAVAMDTARQRHFLRNPKAELSCQKACCQDSKRTQQYLDRSRCKVEYDVGNESQNKEYGDAKKYPIDGSEL